MGVLIDRSWIMPPTWSWMTASGRLQSLVKGRYPKAVFQAVYETKGYSVNFRFSGKLFINTTN
jgi:hypothetical protein